RRSDFRALAEAIAIVAEKVEIATGKNWLQDASTGEELRRGIDVLVRHFARPRVLPEASEGDRSPTSVGESEALKVITIIEYLFGWDENYLKRVVRSDELYRYLQILRDLGSGVERTQAARQEAQAALQEKERRR